MKEGLPQNPLAKKLWRISRILQKSPFDPEILNLTEVQLDFILESYARDHPDEGTFIRAGSAKPLTQVQQAVRWESVLVGRAHDVMLAPMMPSKATLDALKRIERMSKPHLQEGPGKKA